MSGDQPASHSGEADDSRRPARDRPPEKAPGPGGSADRAPAPDHGAGGSRSRAEYAAYVRAAGWQGHGQRPPAGSGDGPGRGPAGQAGRPGEQPGGTGPAREQQPAPSADRGASGGAGPESTARPAQDPGTGHREAGGSALAPRHDSPAGGAPGPASRADYADGLRAHAPWHDDSPPPREQAPDTAGGPAHPDRAGRSPGRPGDPPGRDAGRPDQVRAAEHAPAGNEGQPPAELPSGPPAHPGDSLPRSPAASPHAPEGAAAPDRSQLPDADGGDAARPPRRPDGQDGVTAGGRADANSPEPGDLGRPADRTARSGDPGLAGTGDRQPAAARDGGQGAAPESGPVGGAAGGGLREAAGAAGQPREGNAGQDGTGAAAERPARDGESWPPPQADRDRARAEYREYLKAAAAETGREAGTNVVGEKPDRSPGDGRGLPPTGDQFLRMEKEGGSRADRIRSRLFEESGDLADTTKDVAESVRSILERPPPGGHPVVQAPDRHQGTSDVPQHAQVSAGSLVEAAFVLGIVALKTANWLRHWRPEMRT